MFLITPIHPVASSGHEVHQQLGAFKRALVVMCPLVEDVI